MIGSAEIALSGDETERNISLAHAGFPARPSERRLLIDPARHQRELHRRRAVLRRIDRGSCSCTMHNAEGAARTPSRSSRRAEFDATSQAALAICDSTRALACLRPPRLAASRSRCPAEPCHPTKNRGLRAARPDHTGRDGSRRKRPCRTIRPTMSARAGRIRRIAFPEPSPFPCFVVVILRDQPTVASTVPNIPKPIELPLGVRFLTKDAGIAR